MIFTIILAIISIIGLIMKNFTILVIISFIGLIYFAYLKRKIKSCPVCDYPMIEEDIIKEKAGYSWACRRCKNRIFNEEI
jgi:cbb3-type cytochrome oxidase subunit 3